MKTAVMSCCRNAHRATRVALVIAAALMLIPLRAAADPGRQIAASQPVPQVKYVHETRDHPRLHLHIATIDLTDAAVHVVTPRSGLPPEDSRGQWCASLDLVRSVAQRENLVVAVNGDYFMFKEARPIPFTRRTDPYFIGNCANVCGWAMTDGELWSSRPGPASVVVDEHGKVSIGLINRPPPGSRQIVSSLSMVLFEGRNLGRDDNDLAPRTAAGVDAAAKKLILLVVDGRRPNYSVGMTLHELGDEMLRLGCHDAISLDGGGSSTMVLRDQPGRKWETINCPSDGHDLPIPLSIERPVANVLGVRIDPPAK